MAKLNFNPQSAEKREVAGCLPAGEYLASITESSIAPNSKKTGSVLALTWTCLGEGVKGRKFWQRINVQNQSAEAQRIGQSELREVCEALGMGNQMVDDSAMLHNKPALVKLIIEKDDTGRYDDKNVVRRVSPPNAGATTAGAAPGGFRAPVAGPTGAGGFRAPVATVAANPGTAAQVAQVPAQAEPANTAAQDQADAPVEQQAAAPAPAEQIPPSATPTPAGNMPAWMKRAAA